MEEGRGWNESIVQFVFSWSTLCGLRPKSPQPLRRLVEASLAQDGDGRTGGRIMTRTNRLYA